MTERSQALGHIGVVFTTGLLAASCSFVLDFNQLEAQSECRQCEQVDPCQPSACTLNHCLPEPEDNVACKAEPPPAYSRCGNMPSERDAGSSAVPQLNQGHRLEELRADAIGKVQVLVAKDFLYHVAYIEQDGKPDVLLRAFALDALNNEPASDSPLPAKHTFRVSEYVEKGNVVRSPGSIAVDADNRVVVYVAQGRTEHQTARLSHIVLNADLSGAVKLQDVTDPANYRVSASAGRVGPAAGYLDSGQPFVAWQGCRNNVVTNRDDLCADVEATSAIFTHQGGVRLELKDLSTRGVPEPLAIGALQTLSNGTEPAAVWGTSAQSIVLTAGMPDAQTSVSLPLIQCDATSDYALNSLHAAHTYNGISSLLWSKRLDGKTSITEASGVACGSGKCLDYINTPTREVEQCDSTLYHRRVFNSVRAAAHGVLMLDAEPTIDSEALIVSAKIEELDDGQTRLSVMLNQGSPNPNVSPFLDSQDGELPIAVTGTPGWPELHLQPIKNRKGGVPYSVVAVGWVESEDNLALAKLQTFDLCHEP